MWCIHSTTIGCNFQKHGNTYICENPQMYHKQSLYSEINLKLQTNHKCNAKMTVSENHKNISKESKYIWENKNKSIAIILTTFKYLENKQIIIYSYYKYIHIINII